MPDELGRPCMQHDPMPCGPHYSPIFQPDTRDDVDPTPPPVPAEALQDALDAFFEKLDGDEPLAAGDCWGAAELTAAFKVAAPILLTAGRTAAAAAIRAEVTANPNLQIWEADTADVVECCARIAEEGRTDG